MRHRIQLTTLALGSALLISGCAATSGGGGAAQSKHEIKVFGTGAQLYENWDAEAKRLCNGPSRIENRHAGKGADGREYLVGLITCLPAAK
jgi:hypothetical protein